VLSFPIPLRILFATQPQLLAALLQAIHGVIAIFLINQAELKRIAANTAAVTLIQRFGSHQLEYSSALPRARRRLSEQHRSLR
jgi:hypothetical protein